MVGDKGWGRGVAEPGGAAWCGALPLLAQPAPIHARVASPGLALAVRLKENGQLPGWG